MLMRPSNLPLRAAAAMLALTGLAGCGAKDAVPGDAKLPDGWAIHDETRPPPPRVAPGNFSIGATPPSDAVVLFDGTTLDAWRASEAPSWYIDNGELVATGKAPSLLKTREEFGDVQLHLEYRSPVPAGGESQKRGNSGVFFMGLFEVQIVDTYRNRTYTDGWVGGLFGQRVPLVDAVKPPGEWQSYDIVFSAPRFRGRKLIAPARVTVLLNGVVVQNAVTFLGQTEAANPRPRYSTPISAGPLAIQEHGDATGKVRFRNVWVRPVAPAQ